MIRLTRPTRLTLVCLLLPILDFFYGLVPSYGLAIIALTVVIRLALFPLSAGSIRNARRMRIARKRVRHQNPVVARSVQRAIRLIRRIHRTQRSAAIQLQRIKRKNPGFSDHGDLYHQCNVRLHRPRGH